MELISVSESIQKAIDLLEVNISDKLTSWSASSSNSFTKIFKALQYLYGKVMTLEKSDVTTTTALATLNTNVGIINQDVVKNTADVVTLTAGLATLTDSIKQVGIENAATIAKLTERLATLEKALSGAVTTDTKELVKGVFEVGTPLLLNLPTGANPLKDVATSIFTLLNIAPSVGTFEFKLTSGSIDFTTTDKEGVVTTDKLITGDIIKTVVDANLVQTITIVKFGEIILPVNIVGSLVTNVAEPKSTVDLSADFITAIS